MSDPNQRPGPSKPVGIARSPRRDELLAARGTPDADSSAQAALAAYLNPGGITPPRNVPRIGSFASSNRQGFSSSPALGGLASSNNGSGAGYPASSRSGTASPVPNVEGGIPGSLQESLARGRTPAPVDLEALTDEEKARILRRHLVSREARAESSARQSMNATTQPGGTPKMGNIAFPIDDSSALALDDSDAPTPLPPPTGEEDDEFPVPYATPGGDITHSIYKWQSNAQRDAVKRARSTSLIGRHVQIDPRFEHIHEPGGFRRNYVMMKADERGEAQPPPMLNNFIDFLYIFGHFGGEDLEEEEEGDEYEGPAYDDDHRQPIPSSSTGVLSPAAAGLRVIHEDNLHAEFGKAPERQPLLARTSTMGTTRSLSRRRKRSSSVHGTGDVTVTQAVLMLLKSFIGTGILFLGKAFYNGGILFSALTLCFIALVSLWSFILLIKAKFVVSGSFGDMGGTLYGKWMRFAILFSIVLSQMGFVSAYSIFIASNFQAFVMAVTNCKTLIPIHWLIFGQSLVLVPLSLIRDLAKLSWTALVADAFILVGLVYIASNEVAVIAQRGIADVALFNPKSFSLLIGTAVFAFEGIGLVVPITDAMREPKKFPMVLSGVMIFLMFLFGGAGVLSYLAYGSKVQTVILVNLPSDQKFVQVVQFLYASAILLSTPLQLFPAVRIMENAFFQRSPSGKLSLKVKWQKNFLRATSAFACYFVAWLAAGDLDKFVSFVGSFACIPLCYVYPAMLHYRACARTRWAKINDIGLIVFGVGAAIFTTVQTIQLMFEGGEGSPEFGVCSPAEPGDPTLLKLLLSYLGWH